MPRIGPIPDLRLKTSSLREALLQHPVYRSIRTVAGLRIFMEHHVYAVWDFMTLLKSLQVQFTSAQVLWRPKANTLAARFINEIVLAEESDEDGEGGYCSHFELYLRAMRQCGADTGPAESFMDRLRDGEPAMDALKSVAAPEAVRRFVGDTLEIATSRDTRRIAATFTFGREDLLPDVFRQIVGAVNVQERGRLAAFQYYLERHIELDGDHHGPLAEKMVASLCYDSPDAWWGVTEAATAALQSRLELWDAIQSEVESVEASGGAS